MRTIRAKFLMGRDRSFLGNHAVFLFGRSPPRCGSIWLGPGRPRPLRRAQAGTAACCSGEGATPCWAGCPVSRRRGASDPF
jgi:hypothetical protein